MDVQDIRAITEGVRGEVRKAVIGQDAVIELMLTSLLVGGHILIEGVPVAKRQAGPMMHVIDQTAHLLAHLLRFVPLEFDE